MITKFRLYENSEWKIGDIVYPKTSLYVGHSTQWIVADYPYVIDHIRGEEIRTKWRHNENEAYRYIKYLSKKLFMTEKEWELEQATKKYNL